MKNTTLALFAVLVLLGWTTLAAGVIASFAGQADVSLKVYRPIEPRGGPGAEPERLISDAPCPLDGSPDASVPCPA